MDGHTRDRLDMTGQGPREHVPKVAIVVLNWKGWKHTIECIQSLHKISYTNFRTIVVDNGSEGEDVCRIRPWLNADELVQIEQNRGFSGGNNVGIRHALEDSAVEYVLILNNDTVVETHFLSEMVETARSRGAGMVSPKVLAHADRKTIDRLGLVVSKTLLCYDMKRWEGREPFCPSGCAALYSRQLLEDIEIQGHYFDEDFFAYAEDVDLGLRAALSGYHAALAHRAVVYHKGSASTFSQSPFSTYYSHRNNVWYLAKSVPTATCIRHLFWILIAHTLVVITNMRRRRGLLVLKAKLAGLSGVPKMLRKRRLVLGRRRISIRAFEAGLDHRAFYLSGPRAMHYLNRLARIRSHGAAHLSR